MEKDPRDYYEPMEDDDARTQQPNFIMISEERKPANIQEPRIDDTIQFDPIHDKHRNTEHGSASKKNKKRKARRKKANFFARHKTAATIAACMLLSLGSGFGGAYLALTHFQDNSEVQYQKIIRTSSDGNEGINLSIKEIVTETENSIVEIQTESKKTGNFMREYVSTGAGSGVILTEDGYIVTNHHVIDGANKITVKTKDGTSYDAQLIGSDQKTDLAVIKIEGSDLHTAILGSSDELAVGDIAIAIGNPLGELGGSVSQGIISALDREITIDNQTMTLLQTDTAINPGNSGGGLFNQKGELIGIVNAKSSGSDIEGLGFAIPIDKAKPIIEELMKNGYVSNRPQLGVSLQTVNDQLTAERLGVHWAGVYIASIMEGSSADKAGLKAGDRIVSIDDQEISSASDVKSIIDKHNVGDTLNIEISRDERLMRIEVPLLAATQE